MTELTAQLLVPSNYDIFFIRDQNALNDVFGYETQGENTLLKFASEKLEQVVAFVDKYEENYLSIYLKPAKLAEARAERQLKMRHAKLGEVMLELDDVTLSRLAQAKALLDAVPSLTEVNWELVPYTFVTMSRGEVVQLAVGSGLHVQQCFTHQKHLYEQINAAETAEALALIDVTYGWPNQP